MAEQTSIWSSTIRQRRRMPSGSNRCLLKLPLERTKSICQPFRYRPTQEFLHGDAVAADEKRALCFKCCRKCRCTGMSLRRAAALHLNGGQSRVGLHDEIDLLASLSPIVKLAVSSGRSVGEMCTDRGFNEPPPEFAVRKRLLRADTGRHRHQRSV